MYFSVSFLVALGTPLAVAGPRRAPFDAAGFPGASNDRKSLPESGPMRSSVASCAPNHRPLTRCRIASYRVIPPRATGYPFWGYYDSGCGGLGSPAEMTNNVIAEIYRGTITQMLLRCPGGRCVLVALPCATTLGMTQGRAGCAGSRLAAPIGLRQAHVRTHGRASGLRIGRSWPAGNSPARINFFSCCRLTPRYPK
jgi:hypothetical protein